MTMDATSNITVTVTKTTDAERAALIIRSEANATTETMHATPWSEFLEKL